VPDTVSGDERTVYPVRMRLLGVLMAIVALRIEEIPASLRELFPDPAAYLTDVRQASARRLHEGEMEHLVYYVLQSQRFTTQVSIEPALSAREYTTTHTIPPAVASRADAFLRAELKDDRFLYLRSLAKNRDEIVSAYERAMRFLYEKEFASRSRQGDARREFVAGLYQKRGHSSDTNEDANKAVRSGLVSIQQLKPDWRVQRALVIGPGLDFSPRTSLKEDTPPRSYQPFALREALIALKLSPAPQIRCVDINPRVVKYFDGRPSEISAIQLNILTSRLDESFDLIVATNILLYFDARELLLAMTNAKAMLKPGGVFLHNDPRGEIERYGRELSLPVIHARMIRLSEQRQLFDLVVLHGAP
jgi:SAM-dependent methyltransferase